ncbi:MAG: YbaB/EbfC family nucleoid-associated protein [Bacteroidota bacterium]|nr:YbaB/EbfC family nucleoid-associated protein [Bacteroidota bacterium]
MIDMMKMLGKMKEVQAKVKEAQDKLQFITTTSESGAGLVKATVNGKKQVVGLEIDKDIVNPDDYQMMKDLIIAAVNKAMEDIDGKAKEELRKSTEGFIPDIPGMDLSSMF